MTSLERFIELRPYVFHATREENLQPIRNSRELFSAERLTSTTHNLVKLRGDGEGGEYAGSNVMLGDHLPLHERNIDWQGDWDLQTLLGELNKRVFFFPSRVDNLPAACERFVVPKIGRKLRMKIIRVPTRTLLDHNPACRFEYCKFNSGAPRASGGRKSPRGPGTFLSLATTSFSVSDVREVTALDSVKLPPDTMYTTYNEDAAWVAL